VSCDSSRSTVVPPRRTRPRRLPTSARCHAQPRFHAQCAVSLPNPHPQQEQRFSPVVMPHVCASTMRRQPALQQGIAPDPPRQCKDASTTPMIMCCVFAPPPLPPTPCHPPAMFANQVGEGRRIPQSPRAPNTTTIAADPAHGCKILGHRLPA